MELTNKQRLHDELTDAFIRYQYRLENPMPSANETDEDMILRYRNDHIFHNKVANLASGVMVIVSKYID